MSKIVQMYRPSQYSNWAEAERSGGVYGVEVPEGIDRTVLDHVIWVTCECMSGNDPVVWRYKPAKLTALQEAFVDAYRSNVNLVSDEHLNEFVRSPDEYPHNMANDSYFRLYEAYDMFMAGRAAGAGGV